MPSVRQEPASRCWSIPISFACEEPYACEEREPFRRADERVTDVSATKTVSADVFLKLARTRDRLAAEAEALRAFGRHRAVEVREVRTADHTLVLERAHPGASLASLATEDEAMRVLAGLLAPAWPTVPEGTVAEPLAIFARALDGRQPALGRAAGLLAEL